MLSSSNQVINYCLKKHFNKQKKKKKLLNKKKIKSYNVLATKHSESFTILFLHPPKIKYLFITRLFKKNVMQRLAFA